MAARRRKKVTAKRERKPKKARKPKAPKAPKAPKSVEAPKPGMPMESAAVIVTTLMLLIALILVQYEKGLHYGEGMFDTKYQGSSSSE